MLCLDNRVHALLAEGNSTMRYFFILALIAFLGGCTSSGHTITNLTAKLGHDAKPGDTPIVLLQSGTFEYPKFARANGITGVVTVKVFVRADGTLGDIRVLKRELNRYRVWVYGREGKWDDVTYIFDEVVDDLMKNSKWQPAMANAQPVDAWVTLPLNFGLK